MAISESVAPVLFVGQRGIGKTALLRHVEEQARKLALVIYLEPVDHMTLTERIAEQFEQLYTDAQTFSTKARKKLGKALERLPKLSFGLPNDAGSLDNVNQSSLTAMLRALQEAAQVDHRFLLVLLDEMHAVDVRSLRELAAFANGSAFDRRPALLAGAGLPETRELLENELRTYTTRWKVFHLRLLTNDETVEAIRKPVLDAGDTIEEAATQMIATESGGYPFFIQAYASTAWEHHRSRRITLADVKATLPVVRRRNEYVMYTRPLSRLTPREVAFVLALAESEHRQSRMGDLAKAMGTTTPSLSSTRASLARKGMITTPAPGFVEFKIPFTDRYIREHRQELDDEAVAEYRRSLLSRETSDRKR